MDVTQRKGLASALYSLSNIVAGALLISQFVGSATFRVRPFLLGLALFVVGYLLATWLNREERP
jgi:hypothetical protein